MSLWVFSISCQDGGSYSDIFWDVDIHSIYSEHWRLIHIDQLNDNDRAGTIVIVHPLDQRLRITRIDVKLIGRLTLIIQRLQK